MTRFVKLVACAILLLAVACTAHAQYTDPGPIGLASMEHLELLPYLWDGVQAGQMSSYQRNDDNTDRNNFLYYQNNEHTMLDLKGPGCIYRLWITSLATNNHTLRIYLDNSSIPILTKYWNNLFDGSTPPFLPPFASYSSGGYYSYLPIQFRERCRITISNPGTSEQSDYDWFYYNVTYHMYDESTGVVTYTGTENTSAAAAVWNSTGNPNPTPDIDNVTGSSSIAPGATVTLANVSGPASINSLSLRIPQIIPNDVASLEILENVWLRAYWDGENEPSVNAPLGDFFGSGAGEHTVTSLPLKVGTGSSDWYHCYFPMPFGSNARIEIYNESLHNISVCDWDIRIGAMPNAAALLADGDIGYFHAAFYKEYPTTMDTDYLVLQTAGRGKLVGCTVTMRGLGENYNFLEGDERIHIDGSYTPQIYGTGTEDLFNCGWYYKNGPVSVQTHGCPTKEYPNVSSYRLFLTDWIPYYGSIRFGLEHGDINNYQGNYTSVAYYYEADKAEIALTDVVDIGDPDSEAAHSYTCSGEAWSGTLKMRYGGDDDTFIREDGRRFTSYCQFTVNIDPANQGVKLRRMFDYSVSQQQSLVYVDGQRVRIWYNPGNAADRWREEDFEIPASFTAGKSSITIKIASSNWTEFKYKVYSYLDDDTIAPGIPDAFKAIGLAGENYLVWVNPSDPDVKGVIIRCKETGYPTSPTDGSFVADVQSWPESTGSFGHSNLTAGKTYYYTAWAYDSTGNYSEAVHASAVPNGVACADARLLSEGTRVSLSEKIVTYVNSLEGYCYVEDPDRVSGIRALGNVSGLSIGSVVNVTGDVAVRNTLEDAPCEKQISNAVITIVRNGSPLEPMAMNCEAIGGRSILPYVIGVKDGVGINNIGLLVKIAGKVTDVIAGTPYFYVDDGSSIEDTDGRVGVRVQYCSSTIPLMVGDAIAVTGIIAGDVPDGWTESRRFIIMRGQDDLQVLNSSAGYLSGVVLDSYNRPIPRATVTAGAYSTIAADDGSYVFTVPVGTYNVSASKGGYSTQTHSGVEVVMGVSSTLNFNLPIIGTERLLNRNFESGFFTFWGGRIGNDWGAAFTNQREGGDWGESSFAGAHNKVQVLDLRHSVSTIGIAQAFGDLAPGTNYRLSGWFYQEQSGYTCYLGTFDYIPSGAPLPTTGTAVDNVPGTWHYQELEGIVSDSWSLTIFAWTDYISGNYGYVYVDDMSLLVW